LWTALWTEHVRAIHRLSASTIDKAKRGKLAAGMYPDGGGLYLKAAPTGACSWVYRYMLDRQPRYMGLGSLANVPLADARDDAAARRKLRGNGIDPIDARDEEIRRKRLAAARSMTFKKCAAAFIKAHSPGWKNKVHADQWGSTLEAYAYPEFGNLPVQDIDTPLVMKVLEPIWTTIPETASRVRGRIEKILGWATTSGFRQGDNPARWKGHLENLLPARAKVRKVKHHPALPYEEIGSFMADLRDEEGVAAEALAFTILTAVRTNETIEAVWVEIDLAGKMWIIPPGRMKADKEHRVPLSSAAIAILERMATLAPQINGAPDPKVPVFPNSRSGEPLSNNAMLKLLKRMGRDDVTVHGFRSTFTDWAAEETNFPSEVRDMALAHAVSDEVEEAYRRGDLFKKRVQIMEAWARQCTAGRKPSASDNVVQIRV
jgi:integrase